MGHVKLETTSQGRGCHEWSYLPLSDRRVVAELIKNRSRLDSAYTLKMYCGDGLHVSGAHIFKEPIICTYIDLDELIKRTKLSKSERFVIVHLMNGWSMQDIAD